MRSTRWTAAGVAVLVAAATAGCSYQGAEADRAGHAPSAQAAPAEDVSQTQGAPEASDDGEQQASDASDAGGQESSVKDVDLTPEDGGTVYLQALQNFSPTLETWTVDEERTSVEYHRYTCLGTTESAGAGSLAHEYDDSWVVTWEGEDPTPYASPMSTDTYIDLTDTALISDGTASTHHDIELEKFGGMCTEAGEAVAGFVL